MSENEDIRLEIEQEPVEDSKARADREQPAATTFQQIKQKVSEDDDAPVGSLSLSKIVFGDILSAQMVRRQVWLLLLIVLFITLSVAFRYQCQQDQLQISRLEKELTDIKYKALSSTSNLTECSRESRLLEALRVNHDSVLQISKQPPYIIVVEE